MNTPSDTRYTICFSDDPDEIVTIDEQPRPFEARFALSAGQRGAAAVASFAMTCVLLGGMLLALACMADGATPVGGAVVFAQAT